MELTMSARRRARMVDIGAKPVSRRTALVRPDPPDAGDSRFIRTNLIQKGDVLAAARLAGSWR